MPRINDLSERLHTFINEIDSSVLPNSCFSKEELACFMDFSIQGKKKKKSLTDISGKTFVTVTKFHRIWCQMK